MIQERLDPDEIASFVGHKNASRLSMLKVFNAIDSTNTYLLKEAKLGAASGSACFAEEQTQGRGRLGRSWFSPPSANLYFSLLWRFDKPFRNSSGLSVAVGVIVVSALKKYGIQEGIQLKWPNDVLFAHRKLAGILLESNDDQSVVIGIGLNLDVSPAAEKSWIDLAEITGQPPRRNHLAGLLLNELLEKLSIFEISGLHMFMQDWCSYDVLQDQPVKVMVHDKTMVGTACGINENGELLVRDETEALHAFRYGEVSVRRCT